MTAQCRRCSEASFTSASSSSLPNLAQNLEQICIKIQNSDLVDCYKFLETIPALQNVQYWHEGTLENKVRLTWSKLTGVVN